MKEVPKLSGEILDYWFETLDDSASTVQPNRSEPATRAGTGNGGRSMRDPARFEPH